LASTRRLIAFGTVHARCFIADRAKQLVTADRRQAAGPTLCRLNEDEFQMFGVTRHGGALLAQEWIEAVKLAWGPQDDFDYEGRFIKLKKVRAKPKPFGGTRPLIMNAGASPTGRAFAIRNCDAFFTQASRTSMAETAQRVKEAKDDAKAQGRELDVYAVGVVTCRPTRKEAEEYYHYATLRAAGRRWTAFSARRTFRWRRSARKSSAPAPSLWPAWAGC
jgi:alkanesulfonate monooxygenase SsuD/methylene tetrahydromethanopterin reductase-like flavin-dependent oxidoreductase (luciferase family)